MEKAKNIGFYYQLPVMCSYCRSSNVHKETLTCNDCKTTMPSGYKREKKKTAKERAQDAVRLKDSSPLNKQPT